MNKIAAYISAKLNSALRIPHFALQAATLLLLTACTQSEVFENTSPDNTIGFSTYTGQSTKAGSSLVSGTTFADGAQFGLYCYLHPTDWATDGATAKPNFMYNQEVHVSGTAPAAQTFTYSPIKYWPSNSSKLSFLAYYPHNGLGIEIQENGSGSTAYSNASTGMPKAAFTVQDAAADQVDFMYADLQLDLSKQMAPVPFNFRHALTKITLKAKRKAEPTGVTVVDPNIIITSVKLTGIKNANTFDFASSAWGTPTGTATYNIDNIDGTAITTTARGLSTVAANNTLLLMPQTLDGTAQTLSVTYTQDGEEATVETPITATTWSANDSYTYTLTIDPGNLITFTATATEWDDADTDVELPKIVDIAYNDATSTYDIYTDKGFKAFANLVNGDATAIEGLVTEGEDSKFNFGVKHATIDGKLMTDIDLSGVSWTPIGTTIYYRGSFDGNSKKVRNLYIDASDRYIGLFGSISSGASIQNLDVVDADVTTTYEGNSTSNNAQVGSVVGYNMGGTLTNCYSTGTVEGSGKYANVGGVVGNNTDGTLTNCYSTATVEGDGQYAKIGGVVGNNRGTLTDCYSTGTVKGNITGTNSSATVGGLVGYNYGGTLTKCYSTATVEGSGMYTYVGGMVGENKGTIIACYSTGTVSNSSSNVGLVGGVAGRNSDGGTLTACYSTSAVIGIGSKNSIRIGGVAGYNGNDSSAIITACYSTGSITITDGGLFGGIVGQNSSGTIQYCASVSDLGAPDGIATAASSNCVAGVANIRASEGINHANNNGTVEIDGITYSIRPDVANSIWSTVDITGGSADGKHAPKLFWQVLAD